MKKNRPFILPKKLLVVFSGFGFAMWIGSYYDFIKGGDSIRMLVLAILFSLVSMISAIVHAYKNEIEDRNYWIGSFVFLPFIAPFIYFISRK